MFMLMLMLAGALSIVAYLLDRKQSLNLYLGIILFVVVILTCFMSFWQEHKTSKLMDIFASMAPPTTTVVRAGDSLSVEAAELVVGDVVSFQEGDIIPADMRLLETSSLRVECSSLTGESTPLSGVTDASPEDTPPHEARCLVFSGSVCLQGRGLGLVIRTGDNTMLGQIAEMTAHHDSATETTLGVEIKRFVRFVAVLAVSMAVVFYAIGVARQKGGNALNLFINGFLIVIVANVPQGLPATVTSLLTITARRMASHNVFVKRLDAIETLGSASVIASDKTGTITQNRMTVRELWVNGLLLTRNFDEHMVANARVAASRRPDDLAVHWLVTVAAVCNRASRTAPTEAPGSPTSHLSRASFDATSLAGSLAGDLEEYVGSPSEVALLRFAEHPANARWLRSQFRMVGEVPFNSTNKFHLMVCCRLSMDEALYELLIKPLRQADQQGLADHHAVAMLKGASEIVLAKCGWYLENGQLQKVSPEYTERMGAAVAHFGGQLGRRVMGFAARLMAKPPTDREFSEDQAPGDSFVFFGLAAIADPPRDNVYGAISQCRSAGIKVRERIKRKNLKKE